MNRNQIADAVRGAVESTIYGYDGRLLTGDFWPGRDAIIDAVTDAIMALDGRRKPSLPQPPGDAG